MHKLNPVVRVLAWFLSDVCFFLKRKGAENIPAEGSAILVCNHIHMMDVACIARQCKRKVYFMAKKELFENKLMGWVFSKFGAFPISRGEADISGIRTAMKILKDGDLLVIFPEGTRNKKREEILLPLQEGVAMLALRCKAAIIPSWVEGGYRPWKRCTLLTCAPMDLKRYEDIRKPTQEDMQSLTGDIRAAMLQAREAHQKTF